MPTPTRNIAKLLHQAPLTSQLQAALDLARYLANDQTNLYLLNLETTLTPCIVAVPGANQCNLCVIYGLRTGTGATGIHDNPLGNNFLALTGEYEHRVSAPNVITLPANAVTTQESKLPSENTFERARLVEQSKATKWFASQLLTEKHNLPFVMPVQAFLVIDAINEDIDALVVYKRWQVLKESIEATPGLEEVNTNITAFITAILAGSQDRPSIKMKQSVFVDSPTQVALLWKKTRIQQLFPDLSKQNQNKIQAPTDFTAAELAQAMVTAAAARQAANPRQNNKHNNQAAENKAFSEETQHMSLGGI